MPLTFTEVNAVPDILASNRHSLFFPEMPGVDQRALRISKVRVTLPQRSVGHTIVKILGHSRGFRGNLSFDNVIQLSFLEFSNGIILKSLLNWHQRVRNLQTGGGEFNSNYAAEGTFEVYDTMGNLVYPIRLVNMWPVVIVYPEFGEEGVPAEINAQFNVDVCLLENGESMSATQFSNRFAAAGPTPGGTTP